MGSETARAKSLRSQGAATQSGRSTAGQGLGCGRREAGRPVCRAPGAWLRTWLRRSGGCVVGVSHGQMWAFEGSRAWMGGETLQAGRPLMGQCD